MNLPERTGPQPRRRDKLGLRGNQQPPAARPRRSLCGWETMAQQFGKRPRRRSRGAALGAGASGRTRGAGPRRAPRPRPARRAVSPTFRFVATFLLVALVLFVPYWMSEVTHHFGRVNECIALLCGGMLRWLGSETTRNGTLLATRGGSLRIVSECSAIYVRARRTPATSIRGRASFLRPQESQSSSCLAAPSGSAAAKPASETSARQPMSRTNAPSLPT